MALSHFASTCQYGRFLAAMTVSSVFQAYGQFRESGKLTSNVLRCMRAPPARHRGSPSCRTWSVLCGPEAVRLPAAGYLTHHRSSIDRGPLDVGTRCYSPRAVLLGKEAQPN